MSDPGSPLDLLFNQLDEEAVQEHKDMRNDTSLLSGINTELLLEREREYRDLEKHWVRKNAWLKIAQRIIQSNREVQVNPGGLRYLTLPAYYRLDVSLLLRENLIEVTERADDGQPAQVYVAAFESDPTKFGRMHGQIPRFKLLGASSIEKALVDDKNEYYHQLRELFPFDIVNLDLTTSLTPRNEGPYSQTMQAVETVFELQSARSVPWALFLTFRNLPSDWERAAKQQLFNNLQDNLHQFPKVLEAFQKLYQVHNVEYLTNKNERLCISQSVAKWIVDRAHHYKFSLDLMEIYFYTRHNKGLPPYDIYKQVFIFSKNKLNYANIPTRGLPLQTWMEDDILKCVEKHKCIDVEMRILKASEIQHQDIFASLEQEIDDLCKLIV